MFDWCNKLIEMINESTSENALEYYCQQINSRFQFRGVIEAEQFDIWLNAVYASIIEDVILLQSMNEDLDFYKECYEIFLYKPYICNNIVLLLNNYDNIFFEEDIEKLQSILIGQYFLTHNEDIALLELYSNEGTHSYRIDQEKYQLLKEYINANYVAELVNQIVDDDASYEDVAEPEKEKRR